MTNPAHCYQVRENLIKKKEFESGFSTNNYCGRMNAHIHAMLDLGGDHLQDIPSYIKLMNDNHCEVTTALQNRLDSAKNRGIIGGRRASKKHSKKHRKSKRSKKTKCRRH